MQQMMRNACGRSFVSEAVTVKSIIMAVLQSQMEENFWNKAKDWKSCGEKKGSL